MSITAVSRNYGERVEVSAEPDRDNVVIRVHYPEAEWNVEDEEIVLLRGAALGLASKLLNLVQNLALPAQD
jgi:hypothetical protein